MVNIARFVVDDARMLVAPIRLQKCSLAVVIAYLDLVVYFRRELTNALEHLWIMSTEQRVTVL